MFGLGKKKLSDSGLFRGLTDNHSHILPGVDDGVQDIEDSLSILHKYEELGVSTVWLTPHIMEDIPNETADLKERFEALKAEYDGPIKLHLAAEYMIDNLFNERLEKKDFLYHTVTEEGGSHHSPTTLLVETSYFTPPMDFYGTLEEIKKAGIYPILAHPERYVYMEDNDYDRLKSMDIRLQLNIFSLTGQYGKAAQKKAEKLLEGGYYSLVGSDLHRHSQLIKQLNEKLSKSQYEALSLIAK